jgi:hypothetical protein
MWHKRSIGHVQECNLVEEIVAHIPRDYNCFWAKEGDAIELTAYEG